MWRIPLIVAFNVIRGSWSGSAGPLPRGVEMPVLLEPRVQDHYGFLKDYIEVPFRNFDPVIAPPITRVTNLDDATFQQLVRDGAIFVVDDCMRGFDVDAISNFQCKDFADRWPSGNMRAEYTKGQYHIFLKDKKWYTEIAPQRMHAEHMAGKKKIAGPYIWHVKDEEPLKTKRSVQQHWRTPYFLEHSLANRMEANESFEFWFSMAGGGTFTHADAYCESTISFQFRGKKKWRVQAFPEIRHYFNATSFGDSEIYDGKQFVDWAPETEFTVAPGQCVVFPTGYLHETFVDPVDNGNEVSCYTASTFQFVHPRQVNLYRAYLSRFSMSHYGMTEPCVNGIESYATWLGIGRLSGKPDAARANKKAEEIVKAVDSDGDKQITYEEIHKYFCKGSRSKEVIKRGGFTYNWMKLLTKAQKTEWRDESLRVWAEDALQYHDLNRDKMVTVEELAHGLLQWHVVQHRGDKARDLSKMKSSSKWLDSMVNFETDILSKFYCKDGSECQARDELASYGKMLKGSATKLKRVKGHIQSMFESEEGGDAETLTFVDRDSGNAERKTVGAHKKTEL